jgi:hypothetical protein
MVLSAAEVLHHTDATAVSNIMHMKGDKHATTMHGSYKKRLKKIHGY